MRKADVSFSFQLSRSQRARFTFKGGIDATVPSRPFLTATPQKCTFPVLKLAYEHTARD